MKVGATLLMLAAAAATVTGARGALAQEPEIEVGLGKLPQRVSIFLTARALVSVTFTGDYGPVRVTGSLDEAPKEPLRLTDTAGRAREVSWDEIRTMTNTDYPTEGFPAGSFQVALITDATSGTTPGGIAYRPGITTGSTTSVVGAAQGAWRMLKAPEGTLKLSGSPFGTLSVPTSRIAAFEVVPIIGDVAELPQATIKLEVLQGSTVSVPFSEVRLLQRNTVRGTARVTLMDEQTFTGKVVELPKVSLSITPTDIVDAEGKTPPARTISLEDVVQFERATGGLVRRF
jgi:hypothetical protein